MRGGMHWVGAGPLLVLGVPREPRRLVMGEVVVERELVDPTEHLEDPSFTVTS